jgi:hypothetical protein
MSTENNKMKIIRAHRLLDDVIIRPTSRMLIISVCIWKRLGNIRYYYIQVPPRNLRTSCINTLCRCLQCYSNNIGTESEAIKGNALFKHAVQCWDYIVSRRWTNLYPALVEWCWQRKTEDLWEKPVVIPLCPPQIPHGLAWDWSWVSAARGRQLTAWAYQHTSIPAYRNTSSRCQGHGGRWG